MDTNVRTPQEIFYLPQYIVVPLFQRAYVWDETDQWAPLWQDVVRMAELRLRDPYTSARHFLGAIVLQAGDPVAGDLQTWNVIDGQQRLTTLQLLTDATSSVLEERGLDRLSRQLDDLTHNRAYNHEDAATLKVKHSNRDGDAFRDVMEAEPPISYDELTHAGALISRAHRFFAASAAAWLGDESDPAFARRAECLVSVITQGLQLVVIGLKPEENSQEIFETLNARGTPLTAADLVKNYVFQKLEHEGIDTRSAYAEDWPFETPFWEADVSVGRYLMSRSSLFLSQWLVSRLGEDLSPRQTFTRFKHYVEFEAGAKMSDLLLAIKAQAEQYEAWTVVSAEPSRPLDVTEMAFYRMRATGVELLKPAILWLHDPALEIDGATRDQVVSTLESWVVRRQLLRLPTSDLGRVVGDIIRTHRDVPAVHVADRVRGHLTRLNVSSTYWPGDDEIRAHLSTEHAYRRYPRSRLRMFLEAIEDQRRARHGYPPVTRSGFPIEHLLPQKWETSWPVETLEEEINRSEHVHRLGNLTLLTTSLNSAVSNGPWSSKRRHINEHDVFLLNRDFRDQEGWDEAGIDRRTAEMTAALLDTWPVPEGHAGTISDRGAKDTTWVEIKHLVAAGLISPGTTVTSRTGSWTTAQATVTATGELEVNGQTFATPSAAGSAVRGGATNGWQFWVLPDGRRLADVRDEFRGEKPAPALSSARFDWSQLHAILEALPAGRWTSYVELADAIGTAPQPLGNHVTSCRQCVNAWKVLTRDGHVADNFTWSDPNDRRDASSLLVEDGIRFIDGRADDAQWLGSDELTELTDRQES